MSPDAFHDRLLAFLQNAEYVKLHWCVDKGVRDTGPYVYGNISARIRPFASTTRRRS